MKLPNLGVSSNTYILTDKGQIMIKDIVDHQVNVWNGLGWNSVVIKQTRTNKQLMKIALSNGVEIKCTSEHKFYINQNKKTNVKICKELNIGDELISYKLPKYKKNVLIDDNFDFDSENIPLNEDVNTILNWFSKLCQKYKSLQICSENKEYLLKIRLTLQKCGIESYILSCHIIDEKEVFKLCFNIQNLNILNRLCPQICVKTKLEIGDDINYIVTKTEYLNVFEDAYYFMEKKKNIGIFNGILCG